MSVRRWRSGSSLMHPICGPKRPKRRGSDDGERPSHVARRGPSVRVARPPTGARPYLTGTRQIGDRLHVSSFTVGSHLRHVYQKLGINSRVQLTKEVINHGPPLQNVAP